MTLWFSQYQAVLKKCFLINFRGRQFIKESIVVLILGAIICVIEHFQPNNFLTPFNLTLSILGYARFSAIDWVSQKETHQKQLQKIMGISQTAYLFGWLTYFIINGLLITILMICILVFGVISSGKTSFAEGYSWINIAIIFFLYTVAVIGFTMTLSTFFHRAKTAAQASTFIQLIGSLLFFLRFSRDFDDSRPMIFVSAILPYQAFNMAILKIAFIDQGFSMFTPNFSYEQGCYVLVLDAVFFTLLSIYLDQVWPNQVGTQKHPLFFINWIWRRNSRRNNQNNSLMEQLLRNEQQLQPSNLGKESSAKYEQAVQRKFQPLIKMRNVNRQFGPKKAVNNVTLNFYQKEIFCLLGHNGAGKSTTINILTGMLQHNSGNIQLMGMNYKSNLTQIRTHIGLCLQYNVLYDLLTIQQHLLYYARIKGKTKQQAELDIQRIILKCALNDQRGKFSKNLSGGSKRKLSLANALIGQSKLIFLDEPSSGLDPNSRRAIWDIMKSLVQENRCVILTTHHLEQAQALSQRIGVMSQGKLIIVGDCQYIKKKFNVGYHLIITLNRKNQQQNLKRCKQILQKHFQDYKQDDQTASNNIKIILRQDQVANFSQAFQQLENANIGELTLNVSNLEDAFIKLGTELVQSQAQGAVSDIPDIPDIQMPNVQCRYSYKRQFRAVFVKKAIITLKTLSSLFSIVLPMIFIIIGFVIAVVLLQGHLKIFIWLKRYFMGYFMTLAFVFNTSAFCGSVVLDREKKFKYLSNIMGLRKLPYWTANYAFDSLIFLIPLIPFFVLMYIIQQADFLRQVMHLLIPLLILFCFAFIGYSYFFSFIFQKSNTAYRLFPVINFVLFFMILQVPASISNKSFTAIYVTPFISPFIAFCNAFQTKEFLGIDDQEFFIASLPICFIGLAFQATIFPILTLFMENIRLNMKQKQQFDQMQPQANFQEPRRSQEQQIKEQEMINRSIDNKYPILVENIYKKYPNGYVAIRNNSFRVAEKQIFGLLGPNGAGKSTTFNILTAALPKNSGKVQILGQDVNCGIMQIFENVGVCPQYNVLYQIMTTEQHMQYFARLKGLSEQQIKSTLNFYYNLLSLTPFIKVKSQNLSGGNKRKLCVIMAMLANPSIMFYDQPSAGVDPISRRYLWKAFSLSVKNFKTSMVLTTHSMNQAESLCNRIGILIKGQFIALDTPKNLTLKYGKGFRIIIYCSQQDKKEQIKKNFLQEFGNQISIQEIPESNNLGLLFVIPSSKFNLSSAYGLCQNRLLMKQKMIVKYHIAQSTLQEVFIHLSKMQPQLVEQQQYRQPWQCLCWEFGATGCMCLV